MIKIGVTWSDIWLRGVSARRGEQSSLQEYFHPRPVRAEQQPGGGGELQEEKQEILQSELQRSWSHECLLPVCSSRIFTRENSVIAARKVKIDGGGRGGRGGRGIPGWSQAPRTIFLVKMKDFLTKMSS